VHVFTFSFTVHFAAGKRKSEKRRKKEKTILRQTQQALWLAPLCTLIFHNTSHGNLVLKSGKNVREEKQSAGSLS
jgi:hypothetical protein